MMKGTSVCDACTLAVRLTIVLEFYDDGFSEEVADAVLASSARGSSVVVDEVVNPFLTVGMLRVGAQVMVSVARYRHGQVREWAQRRIEQ